MIVILHFILELPKTLHTSALFWLTDWLCILACLMTFIISCIITCIITCILTLQFNRVVLTFQCFSWPIFTFLFPVQLFMACPIKLWFDLIELCFLTCFDLWCLVPTDMACHDFSWPILLIKICPYILWPVFDCPDLSWRSTTHNF